MKLKTFFLIHAYLLAALFFARMFVAWLDPELYFSCRLCIRLDQKLGLWDQEPPSPELQACLERASKSENPSAAVHGCPNH